MSSSDGVPPPPTSLPSEVAAAHVSEAEAVAEEFRARRSAAVDAAQPVHTVYVPADRFTADTVGRWGDAAATLLDAHGADTATLARWLLIDTDLAGRVRWQVAAKLDREPVEDVRVDFEDGYGETDAATEDADAVRAATALAATMAGDRPPRMGGLRIASLADDARRGIRTLDIFLTALLDATGGALPAGFVVTVPKVVDVRHVTLFAALLDELERAVGLPHRTLRFEVQVEATESILDRTGRVTLPAIVDAADGRLLGAHFGVFDYTAACGLPSNEQRIDHPACDFARHVMQVTLAGTGVRLSDGSINLIPASDTTDAVTDVWRAHAAAVRHSLRHGYMQGWDMHPSHLVSRFGAVYAFHLAAIGDVLTRLRAAAAGGGGGGRVDEPATLRTLRARVEQALSCGAVSAADLDGLEPA